MSRLIVVSNRVAIPREGRQKMAGGLAVAVNAAMRQRGGIWFGWSGETSDDIPDEPRWIGKGNVSCRVTDLTPADVQEYYNGFANRVLWPLMHYRVDLAEFSRADLSGYMRVNHGFAARLARFIEPDDVIWIHDYHLMPLAKFLRELGFGNRIGFFLHIPFPPLEVMLTLPHHREVTGALVEYDLVGLQTENDRLNFARYMEFLGYSTDERDGNMFAVGARRLRSGAFPVGIDTDDFMHVARRMGRSNFIHDFRKSIFDRSLVIGVDRLDYTKGIAERMSAFEHFLAANESWRGRVTYLQITPRSRSEVQEYADMERATCMKVGSINGIYGDATWTPIRYVNRSYDRSALAGLYRVARIGLVTPLRDGMNLVAKEYVAAQNPLDPGVLILSAFAGAADELSDGALVVNPHEAEAVAPAIRRGLEMPLGERRDRYRRMMRVIREHDINHWADNFLASLMDEGEAAAQPSPEAAPRPPVTSSAGGSNLL